MNPISNCRNVYFDFMGLLCKSDNHEGTFSILSKNQNYSSETEELIGLSLEDLGGFYLDDYTHFLDKVSDQFFIYFFH